MINIAAAFAVASPVGGLSIEAEPVTSSLPAVGGLSIEAKSIVSSETFFEPGFIGKLELIKTASIPDDDPVLPSLIPPEEFLEFTKQTKIEWSEATKDILLGAPYVDILRSGFMERIRDKLYGYELIDEAENERYVPIAELHRPKISGCKSTLSLSSVNEYDYSFLIKVFGFGGGLTASRSFGRNIKITIDECCAYYCAPVKFKVSELKSNNKTFCLCT